MQMLQVLPKVLMAIILSVFKITIIKADANKINKN